MLPAELPRSVWMRRQSLRFLNPNAYSLSENCRNAGKLVAVQVSLRFDMDFAECLLKDEWWKEVDDRSADLILEILPERGTPAP
jgi:hypothetical protein